MKKAYKNYELVNAEFFADKFKDVNFILTENLVSSLFTPKVDFLVIKTTSLKYMFSVGLVFIMNKEKQILANVIQKKPMENIFRLLIDGSGMVHLFFMKEEIINKKLIVTPSVYLSTHISKIIDITYSYNDKDYKINKKELERIEWIDDDYSKESKPISLIPLNLLNFIDDEEIFDNLSWDINNMDEDYLLLESDEQRIDYINEMYETYNLNDEDNEQLDTSDLIANRVLHDFLEKNKDEIERLGLNFD